MNPVETILNFINCINQRDADKLRELMTAREAAATLWTQDADFRKIEGVKYCRK